MANETDVSKFFDPAFYTYNNPELSVPGLDPFLHYISSGWAEGRSPGPLFNVAAYLLEHPDIRMANIEPVAHYLDAGKNEGRAIRAACRWSDLFPGIDRVEYERFRRIISTIVNRNTYFDRAGLLNVASITDFDIPIHFMNIGFKFIKLDGDFDAMPSKALCYVLDSFRAMCARAVDVEFASVIRGYISQIETIIANRKTKVIQTEMSDHDRYVYDVILGDFDSIYYVDSYARDVDLVAIDPCYEFTFVGWREGRNPNRWFDCNAYLEANSDVRDAGLNPYYHFLAVGREEGRTWKRQRDIRKLLIESASPPRRRPRSTAAIKSSELLASRDIETIISQVNRGDYGVIFSISHDSYVNNVGGIQIFISDEQKLANNKGYSYVHIAPVMPRMHLVSAVDYVVHLTVDGRYVGMTSIDRVIRSLSGTMDMMRSRYISIHCLLGHSIDKIQKMCAVVKPKKTFFWIHDYSSICEGFTLLRNDVSFCGVPKMGSMACRVCIYGESREAHREDIGRMFDRLSPIVVAPSDAALRVWLGDPVRHAEALVVAPHVEIVWGRSEGERNRRYLGSGSLPVVVAYVGYPAYHKGWGVFLDAVAALGSDPRYRFVHIVDPRHAANLDGVETVPLVVTPENRFAAIQIMKDCGVDIVLNTSLWPETFSYVTYEAMASGAFVFCLSVSGNVADAVRNNNRGIIFDSDKHLIKCLVSGEGINFLKSNYTQRELDGHFDIIGTTVAVIDALQSERE